MQNDDMHAPTLLLNEIRAALSARDDTTLMDVEDGQQPLAEQPEYFEPFQVAHIVSAIGPLPLSNDVNHLIVLFVNELRNRKITPSLTRPPCFGLILDEKTKEWRLPLPAVFFHTLGYPLAIQIDVPDVADVLTTATLTISTNVDSDCL